MFAAVRASAPERRFATGWRTQRFQSSRWQTNSLLLQREGESVLVDPGLDDDEVELIASRVPAGDAVHLLITHGDDDHVAGIGAFPGATVVTGAATAARIGGVDRVVAPGRFALGSLQVLALDAPGHAVDGTAWLFPELRLMAAGDYLSAAEVPIVFSSIDDAYETLRRLRAALDNWDVDELIPGHGEPLTRGEAWRVAGEDLAYLAALRDAAAMAWAAGASEEQMLRRLRAIETPREGLDDLGGFDPAEHNVGKAAAEVAEGRTR
jgi:hydroxyacylglutathione hydrolase